MWHSIFKKTLFTAALFIGINALCAETTLPQEQSSIQLKLEVTDSETSALGLTKTALEKTVTTTLAEQGIGITEDAKAPSILVRFKSVQAANVVASFIQVAFFEEAELIRGKSRIQAMTWSQATLLTTSKDEFMTETSKTIDAMITAFVHDYKQAFHSDVTTPAKTAAPTATTPAATPTPAAPQAVPTIPEQMK